MTERVILERSFAQGLAMTDGRTVEGRCVPYGQIADIWSPEEGHYREQFDLGVFDHVCKAPHRVAFRISHADAYANMVGYGTDLEERDDGLYGSFRLLESDAPKARELIKESYHGLSVGFLPLARGSVRVGDVLHRVKAHLDHVAAVVEGTAAYSDAKVLAMRQHQDHKYQRGDTLDDGMIIGDEMPPLEDDEALKTLQAYNVEQRSKIEKIREMIKVRS